MTSGGKLIEGIFSGETINTPSMLCVEDYIDALLWAKQVGGLKGLMARADANAKVIADFVAANDWIANLAVKPETRLQHLGLPEDRRQGRCWRSMPTARRTFAKGLVALLEKEGVAYDIGALSRRAVRPAHLGRCHDRNRRHAEADAVAFLGLRDPEGNAFPGCCLTLIASGSAGRSGASHS